MDAFLLDIKPFKKAEPLICPRYAEKSIIDTTEIPAARTVDGARTSEECRASAPPRPASGDADGDGVRVLSPYFITRVAPHCVNTLMILHAAHED